MSNAPLAVTVPVTLVGEPVAPVQMPVLLTAREAVTPPVLLMVAVQLPVQVPPVQNDAPEPVTVSVHVPLQFPA